ncbi:MAG: non-ribosomal peptide synthetase, partial [Candidatus Aminicenantes bacterium]|nr:non-ribosomal peptide synthetase [Candidatus Aminicenantes bacterium]
MKKTPGEFKEISAEKKRELLARLLQEEAGKANTYPLSFGQERLWFLNRLEGSGAAYNMSWPLHLKGFFDVKILERSVNEIVRRHEILRTTFDMENGKPVQVVAAALSLGIAVTDLRHLPKSKLSAAVRQSVIKEFQLPFDLRKDPLLRVSLLRRGELDHVLLLVMHHIVSDAWSLRIFISEVTALYDAFSNGNPSPLPELSIQYVDFSSWQRQWFTGRVLETQLNYWKNKLAGLTPILEFPTDHPRPPIQSYRGRIEHFQIDAVITQKLERLSKQTGSTLFMTLLAAFAALIFRYSSQEDIAIGTPIALRDRREIETLIGFFVNTLVLRIDLSGKPTFLKLLRRVRRVALEAYKYKELPFELIVEELQPDRNLSCSPLFQVMFILQNVPIEKLELPGVTIDIMKREIHTTKFDLTLSMTNTEAGLMAELKYSSDLFDVTTITRLAEHFQILLKAIAGTPGQQVSELPLLTKSEKNRLLVEWNDSHAGYRHNRLIHELFELQVEKSSGKLALVYDDKKVTYGVLNGVIIKSCG